MQSTPLIPQTAVFVLTPLWVVIMDSLVTGITKAASLDVQLATVRVVESKPISVVAVSRLH